MLFPSCGRTSNLLHRLLLIGLATAFLGSSQSEGTVRHHPIQQRSKYVSVKGNLFLAPLQSLGSKSITAEAHANLSFDDHLEQLLDHGW